VERGLTLGVAVSSLVPEDRRPKTQDLRPQIDGSSSARSLTWQMMHTDLELVNPVVKYLPFYDLHNIVEAVGLLRRLS
jgi:hypothetical protein